MGNFFELVKVFACGKTSLIMVRCLLAERFFLVENLFDQEKIYGCSETSSMVEKSLLEESFFDQGKIFASVKNAL